MDKINELIHYYSELTRAKLTIEKNIADAKENLLTQMNVEKLETYTTEDGLRATVTTPIRRTIRVEEAEKILPEEILKQLIHESIYTVLTIRKVNIPAPAILIKG